MANDCHTYKSQALITPRASLAIVWENGMIFRPISVVAEQVCLARIIPEILIETINSLNVSGVGNCGAGMYQKHFGK